MSKAKQIIKLTEQGLTPKEIAKRIGAKINYVYFVRNKVKKGGKKKPSEIISAAQRLKNEIDALDKIKDKPETTRMSQEDLDFLRTKPKYRMASAFSDPVNHPPHYKAGGIDFIDFAEAKGLTENAYLFNVVKYVVRAGKKVDVDPVQDLEKAEFYLKREIARRKRA
jgi:DNA-binding CsgD family transcriptional regulator